MSKKSKKVTETVLEPHDFGHLKKFHYRIVEDGKASGLVIKRNGNIFAETASDASDKLNRRYNLIGGGVIEKWVGDKFQPCVIKYSFNKEKIKL